MKEFFQQILFKRGEKELFSVINFQGKFSDEHCTLQALEMNLRILHFLMFVNW